MQEQEFAGYVLYIEKRKQYYTAEGRCIPFRVYTTLKGAERIARLVCSDYSSVIEIRKVFIEVPE